jgi:EAL domain-containing protein (putative c-di-GMP-specific phosphodiesterase class I)
VSPARFIAAAEENGLILPIGEWVLRTACAFACSLGRPDLRVAVNLSARQFSQPDTVQMIEDVLRTSGLDPRRLELEVTESAVMSEIEEVILRLDRLRGLGVQLALDDFGTGFSSLSYLKRFRFHRIKVDGTFVRDLPHDGDSVAIVSAIIAMAHGLGLEVVAEGVETEAQLAFLRERGCDAFQGYLFSPVLSSSEIQRYLAPAPTPKGP